MVRWSVRRFTASAGALAVTAALVLGLAPAAAHAEEAPKPAAKPTTVKITGKDLGEGIVVQQSEQPRLFGSLLGEVSWMASARAQTAAPKANKLGPKYTLTVLVKNKSTQVYDLYPMAAGGPRAARPAAQPSGKKTSAWFYGRLTMPETLRVSGVPLESKPDVVAGGIGGGIGETVAAEEVDPVAEVNGFVGQMRQLLLLNGAVVMVILVGLAGIAFLIRRKV